MALDRAVRSWLLTESDPSVRYFTLTRVLGRPERDDDVRAAKAQIGREGWAARILAEQLPTGQWAVPGRTERDLYVPKYTALNWRLIVLCELGASGRLPRVRKAVDLFLRVYGGRRGLGARGSELCFVGNAARLLIAFGRTEEPEFARCLAWLLRSQKADGGWHCFPSSTGTLDAWEGLAAFAALPPGQRTRAIDRAVERGAEFYLERGLLREGRGAYPPWERLHYPRHYYYDVLVGLEILARLGYAEDRRLRPALDLLERKRDRSGRWAMDALHPDSEDPDYQIRAPFYPLGLEAPGRPSRWITWSALSVLRHAGRL